jgi:enoyl-CoA hydratase
MNLALGCDVRIAAQRARFDTRFLTLGIHPGGGHTWMLQRLVGSQAAMAAVLFGEILDGPGAERIGLVHRCVADDDLMTAARALAAGAAGAPRELVVVTKATMKDMGAIDHHDEAIERELEPQVWSTRQPFFTERLAAMQARISSR